MTNRRNFLKAVLASTALGFLGCRDKKQWPPPMDAPLDEWKKGPNSGISSREAMARARAYAEKYLSQGGGPRFPHRFDGNLLTYLGLSPDRVRAADARGLAQRQRWSLTWGRLNFKTRRAQRRYLKNLAKNLENSAWFGGVRISRPEVAFDYLRTAV